MPNVPAKAWADAWLREPTATISPESVCATSAANARAMPPVPITPQRSGSAMRPGLAIDAHLAPGRQRLLHRHAEQMILQPVGQRVRLRSLAARPGAGLLEQQRHGEVVLGEACAGERVAVHDAAVEADVVELVAL